MHIDLSGKVAIVTGGGRGIGRGIAQTLAREGCVVVVTDIREDLLGEVTAEWRKEGWKGAQLLGDVRSKDDCARIAMAVEKQFGRIDILVNNAGVASGARLEALSEEVWDANQDANLKGTFLMCQAVIPAMKKQQQGRILNASSFAAIVPSIGGAAYASSKMGVIALTRVLASELGPDGITVNAYAPGMVPTLMNRFADAPEARKEKLLDTLSLRRWSTPQDIANLIVFLSSDLAGYITGTLIDTSGGKLATQMPWMAWHE
jgi:3-oxoacyl-[acyl-carrier protein] reductase